MSNNAEETGTEREVGYCKPPIESRFKVGNRVSRGVSHGKGQTITSELKKLLREKMADDPHGRRGREIAARALFKHFLKGNGKAIDEVMKRTEGVVKGSDDDGANVNITITDARVSIESKLAGLAKRSDQTSVLEQSDE
jgi:hypothetical protein